MMKIATLVVFVFVTIQTYAQETNYQKNLKLASELLFAESEFADRILLRLVPDNYEEFDIFYGTTHSSSKMRNTGSFHPVTQQIFDRYIVEKKEAFYSPSIQLASLADGGFGEPLVENLLIIITLDKNKFCESIKGKEFANHNPTKYPEQTSCK
jgi:hypothetical protein